MILKLDHQTVDMNSLRVIHVKVQMFKKMQGNSLNMVNELGQLRV